MINGTRTVDVQLEGELPDGARPDLSVDGTIELERLNDVVYVGRPVFGQPNSTITLFRLDPDSKEAIAGPGEAGAQFGEHNRGCGRLEGRRTGDPVGYVGPGCAQPDPIELSAERNRESFAVLRISKFWELASASP